MKAKWVALLLVTPRGVGWNFGSRRVNTWRQKAKLRSVSRLRFLVERLFQAFVANLVADIVSVMAANTTIPSTWTWDALSIARVTYAEVLLATQVYFNVTFQHHVIAIISVALFLSRPEVSLRVSIRC